MKPFDLEKALAGEPVKLHNGKKAIIYANIEQYFVESPLKGVIVSDDNSYEEFEWTLQGKLFVNSENKYDIVGMWEEPRPTINVTLPCPLKEPQPDMWFITSTFTVTQSTYSSDTTKEKTVSEEILEQGLYFASREDAQIWLDTLKNNRK